MDIENLTPQPLVNLLLVEDDNSLGQSLTKRLTSEGYKVFWATTAKQALAQLKNNHFSGCILDIGLPDGSGFSIAREVKNCSFTKKTPIIFLTAMNSAEYRLEGFEIGCDDYVPKPFHLKELLLRVKKAIQINEQIANSKKELTFDDISFSVKLPNGDFAFLKPSDYSLLKLLFQSSPAVVTRQEAFQKIFNCNAPVTRSIDNAIVRIRTALGQYAQGRLKTVRTVGYQWV